MKVFFLPTESEDEVREISAKVEELGHYVLSAERGLGSVMEKVFESNVVLAVGNLTSAGLWSWGYAHGIRKKVVAISGVRPRMVVGCNSAERWLKSLPVQGDLFKNCTVEMGTDQTQSQGDSV